MGEWVEMVLISFSVVYFLRIALQHRCRGVEQVLGGNADSSVLNLDDGSVMVVNTPVFKVDTIGDAYIFCQTFPSLKPDLNILRRTISHFVKAAHTIKLRLEASHPVLHPHMMHISEQFFMICMDTSIGYPFYLPEMLHRWSDGVCFVVLITFQLAELASICSFNLAQDTNFHRTDVVFEWHSALSAHKPVWWKLYGSGARTPSSRCVWG